jgi:hypothetical protein
MEYSDMINLWKKEDARLQVSLAVNSQAAGAIISAAVKPELNKMKPAKIFAIIIGLLWVIVVGSLLLLLREIVSVAFFVSIGMQVLITAVAVGVYLWQLILIRQINNEAPVLQVQQRLAQIIMSTLWVTRILFLQLPLWTTFFWHKAMFPDDNLLPLIISVLLTLLFTLAAIWLFVQIRFENRNKKWFQFLFEGKEWSPLMKAMDILEQGRGYNE